MIGGSSKTLPSSSPTCARSTGLYCVQASHWCGGSVVRNRDSVPADDLKVRSCFRVTWIPALWLCLRSCRVFLTR